jgi:hypothetical protein
MRHVPPLALLPLLVVAACAPWTEPAGALLAADAASITVFGRGIGDLAWSAASGRNCSVVRLEQGKTYCKPLEPPPPAPPLCTRSLGTVDCWSNPEALSGATRGVADAPKLTPEQESNRTARWPNL